MTSRTPQPGASAKASRSSSGKGTRAVSSARPRAHTKESGAKRAAKAPATRQRSDVALNSRWFMLPLIVVGVFALVVATYYPVMRVQYRETREQHRLATELAALKARNARLSTSVAKLRTPEGVEDYARTQLGMAKKGEHVLVVVDGKSKAATTTVASAPMIDSDETTTTSDGPWTAFLDVVFQVN